MVLSKIERKVLDQSRLLCPILCEGRCRHLTMATRRNTIICVGANSYRKSHPLSNRFHHLNGCKHSETDLIVNFPYLIRDINRFTLFNVRVDKYGNIKLSKPCKDCQKLLYHFNVKRIYYSNEQGFFEEMEIAS